MAEEDHLMATDCHASSSRRVSSTAQASRPPAACKCSPRRIAFPTGICTCLSTYTSAGGVLNGNKRVNMVHVDDIIAATRQCLITPRPEERLNVAGHNFRLSQLIAHCKHPEVPDGPDTDLSSKYVWCH